MGAVQASLRWLGCERARAGHICQWEAGARTDERRCRAETIFSKAAICDWRIVVLRARWRLRYKLGCRNPVEMMAEWMSLAHTTLMRWVQRHVPEFENAVEPLRASSSWIVACRRDLGQSKGRWTYPSLPRHGQSRKDLRISSFAPSEMLPPLRCFFVGRSRTRVDRRARSRSRAIKLRVGLLVRFPNSTALGDYDQRHRTHASRQERSIRPE